MMRYGFQRLVLLGSADYRRAELPLDDAVSLIAPNNTGKTSLINALQFLLIIDRRRMDFGAHEVDKSRRFYFPDNSAYILLEVVLPQSGAVVFGCVGKGVSHDYEYFAYQGELVVEEFRDSAGALVQQPQLAAHLAARGRTLYRYASAAEFAGLIYGGNRARRSDEPDFTVFRLEHAGDARAFQQVLTRTLRLDRLSSADVKAYLLQIFRRDLPDANIDFKQAWEKAFHEVNAERAQYLAAERQGEAIAALERAFEERLVLRGKLLDWRPRIDDGLAHWQSWYEQQLDELASKQAELEGLQAQQTELDREMTRRQVALEGERDELQRDDREQAALAQRLALVPDRLTLEQQLAAAGTALERHITLMGQTEGRPVAAIEAELGRQQQRLEQLRQQRDSLDDNLYRRLAEQLDAADLERLNRALNAAAMTLPPADFALDPAALRTWLAEVPAAAASPADSLALPGLRLSLHGLRPQHTQLSAAELDAQIADAGQQIASLQAQLEVAHEREQALARKATLAQQHREAEQALADYDRLQALQAQAAERAARLQALTTETRQLEQELAAAQQRAAHWRDALNALGERRQALTADHRRIEQLRDRRLDTGPTFDHLPDQPHHLWRGETDWALPALAERLQGYQDDCQRLLQLDRELRTGLAELHGQGLTKYQYSDSEELELRRIIDFSHQLPREREALEKKARSAVVNVTASLRELRDGLWAFQSKMREFNRLIGQRPLSDLKTFKIEAEDEAHLVAAIDTLISTAEQVETGESFELFNQASVLDDAALERAKQVLIEEGNARQGLRVADLFRLVFVVGKVGRSPETFEDIDSAASNGTVLMAKLVTGLAMLHLMQDKRHDLRAVCYLDEALALDARNQASLIQIADEFGFALIFAAPAPVTTARYCVPIHQQGGQNHISRESWQILEPLDASPAGDAALPPPPR